MIKAIISIVLSILLFLSAGASASDGNRAWKIESMTSFLGEREMYNVDILTMKDGHLYTLEFNTEPLEVPKTLPIGQKMIDSFKITTPEATTSPPNATESINPVPFFTNGF